MFDFWKEANIGRSADIMASPEHIPILEKLLAEQGIHYTEMIKELQLIVCYLMLHLYFNAI